MISNIGFNRANRETRRVFRAIWWGFQESRLSESQKSETDDETRDADLKADEPFPAYLQSRRHCGPTSWRARLCCEKTGHANQARSDLARRAQTRCECSISDRSQARRRTKILKAWTSTSVKLSIARYNLRNPRFRSVRRPATSDRVRNTVDRSALSTDRIRKSSVAVPSFRIVYIELVKVKHCTCDCQKELLPHRLVVSCTTAADGSASSFSPTWDIFQVPRRPSIDFH